MVRIKSPASIKHKKIRLAARGYKQARHRRLKAAKDAILHAGAYAFHGRKRRKRDLRALWIMRLNSACRKEGLSYSHFISSLKEAGIIIDRKILSDIAVNDESTFKQIISQLK